MTLLELNKGIFLGELGLDLCGKIQSLFVVNNADFQGEIEMTITQATDVFVDKLMKLSGKEDDVAAVIYAVTNLVEIAVKAGMMLEK